jgi:uncharacterized membrane protein (UPF0127 family)
MSKLQTLFRIFLAASTFLAANISYAQQNHGFPVISLNIGIHLIRAEVASTAQQREQGLMFREKMGPNEGMVFLFSAPTRVCMWMKNTLIPLSVAFIDKNGRIVNIEEMKAQTLDTHCGMKPVPYALEMNSEWFKQKNIKPGMVIDGLPGAQYLTDTP